METASLTLNARIRIAPGHRLQFEPAQDGYVLLYPEGMVVLGESAAAIMNHLKDGEVPLSALLADLTEEFEGADLEADVRAFVEDARDRGWLQLS